MAATTALWMGTRLPETLAPENRHPLSLARVGRAFAEIATHRRTMAYLLATACVFSAFVGYLTSAQQILQELYGLGPLFPVAFGVLAGSIGLASFVNARLVMRLGMRRLVPAALAATSVLAGLLAAFALAFGGVPPLFLVFALLIPVFFGLGTTFGNLNALAMQPMGHIAGSAAAVIGAGTTTLSATLGSLIGQAYDGTILPLALAFALFPVLALLLCRWAERGAEEEGIEI
jgi:MFS transporter, DHA1 family, multidrug resistance protein